ncbi:MAG TPA: oxygen-dependent coproporphyrinogen oxidase [Bacteroidia bacterium]|nr:oxygen-dependent coproporphyrinogen oxidase [Bacteroidia bacterium]
MLTKESIAARFRLLQDDICTQIETVDGSGKFVPEEWQRDGGGGGVTRVLQHGTVLEKAGVNFSAVHGELPDNIQAALKVNESVFFATGVSIVMHPVSPMVPIIHMNIRYFELDTGEWWFGGGIDLTPHYVVEADAKFFHGALRQTCDNHNRDYYPRFKKWADDYFFITHRNETRGIGGIFFDRLSGSMEEKEKLFEFVMDVGQTFAPTYTELIRRNRETPFGPKEKEWQLIRRGRYVEFNLVYDKGTKFGLDTGGRIESILMSLPENASWKYNFQVEKGSPEDQTQSFLKKNVDW